MYKLFRGMLLILCIGLVWYWSGSCLDPDFKSCRAEEKTVITGTMEKPTSIRSAPSLKGDKVRKAEKGESGEVLEESGNKRWLKIKFADGTVGWVAGRLVKIEEKAVKEPVPEPPIEPIAEPEPAPEPATLLLEIVGSVGLLMWKRKSGQKLSR